MKKIIYNSAITREQFLYHELRTTARLWIADSEHDKKSIVSKIISENLFQYPTERSLKRMANVCIKRLEILNDDELVKACAEETANISKQICLYAMMKQYAIVRDFMITVVGEKYRISDHSFGKSEVNYFILRLQEQNEDVSAWSESTLVKVKQVLMKLLAENEYLDSIKSEKLNDVRICSVLKNAIIASNDLKALAAFNCFTDGEIL